MRVTDGAFACLYNSFLCATLRAFLTKAVFTLLASNTLCLKELSIMSHLFNSIRKYPSTPHLDGSGLQKGDKQADIIPFSALLGRNVIYEEKLDGANTGFGFHDDATLFGQSRGHYLDLAKRGGRERHFNRFKDLLLAIEDALFDRLAGRYIVYGEWLFAAHTLYYDRLPHYFHEFDVFDTQNQVFLDTPSRHQLLQDLPFCHVPVLYQGPALSLDHLKSFIQPSLYRSLNWQDHLVATLKREGLDEARNMSRFEASELSEGIYGKVEENGIVTMRFKFVRPNFVQTIIDNNSHWHSRPIVPNGLIKNDALYQMKGDE
ncbi:RNA ligase family protein [Bartonella sp. HY038]|uniref:RNA ligase family protein n=1 Tax=Bartonella sp. HY038 TaxID=2759660 RepID=UPI001AEE9826|nr:RNA ligase family protein [Bartonella sp. HY038]